MARTKNTSLPRYRALARLAEVSFVDARGANNQARLFVFTAPGPGGAPETGAPPAIQDDDDGTHREPACPVTHAVLDDETLPIEGTPALREPACAESPPQLPGLPGPFGPPEPLGLPRSSAPIEPPTADHSRLQAAGEKRPRA